MAIDLGETPAFRPPTDDEKDIILNILGALKIDQFTTESILNLLKGSAEINEKIGEEYIPNNLSKLKRTTQVLTPADSSSHSLLSGADLTLYLTPTQNINLVSFTWPVDPIDGQIIVFRVANSYSLYQVRLYNSFGGYTSTTFTAGDTYAFQYFESLDEWLLL